MLIPIEWLKEFVQFDLDADRLAERLTMAGLEVEEVLRQPEGEVLSIYITPNRGDCLSVFGIAREVYALLGDQCQRTPLYERIAQALNQREPFEAGEAAQWASVVIEDPALCPRYAARVIRGIKVAPSPAKFQRRLNLADMRPISNLVDATNYVMLELGQPLHAFDLETLADHQIVVRQAREGETIQTLDGNIHEVQPPMLMICDSQKPVAVAGVMGGAETEVSDRTVNLLLESAHFDPLSVRRTAKTLDIRTEASYRFERHVDPRLVSVALNRVCELIEEMTGAPAVTGMIDVYPAPPPQRSLTVRMERAEHLLGFSFDDSEAVAALERLELRPTHQEARIYQAQVPAHRQDIALEEDLVEEIGRILGYDRIPEAPPVGVSMQGRDSDLSQFLNRLRHAMLTAGLQEVVNSSFEQESPLHPPGVQAVPIRNPMRPELSVLRPCMLNSLVATADYNQRRGVQDIAIFEAGRTFRQTDGQPPYEEPVAFGLLLTGKWRAPHWQASTQEVDFYALKGCVEHLLARLGITLAHFEPLTDDPRFHPGRAARVYSGDHLLGVMGELHPEIMRAFDLKRRHFAAEFEVAALQTTAALGVRFQPLPKLPAVLRDLAIVVDQNALYADIEATVRAAAGEWLEECRLFDRYVGQPVPEGHHSLAFALTFRNPRQTLTDEEVNERMEAIFQALETRFQAQRRA
ncbi:MAG: phenylalanine--tRNA ligase subunit beta [Fimbriimonadia bacterium]|nr:phenylalanine--tRNA ligase subunit beta [Fimbriimonadia bacterium]